MSASSTFPCRDLAFPRFPYARPTTSSRQTASTPENSSMIRVHVRSSSSTVGEFNASWINRPARRSRSSDASYVVESGVSDGSMDAGTYESVADVEADELGGAVRARTTPAGTRERRHRRVAEGAGAGAGGKRAATDVVCGCGCNTRIDAVWWAQNRMRCAVRMMCTWLKASRCLNAERERTRNTNRCGQSLAVRLLSR